LLGSGNELEKLKETVLEKNLENSVEFKGWIEREKIPENISDASIGIGPLRLTDVTSQALPIKVLEYMAVSLPIIAQKGTLPDDILVNGKNGYFVNGAEDLAEKISSLLNEPDTINQMGNQSRLMVQNFSWDHIIKNVLEAARKN
jgi:colanic acid biosynthesis glycosyl transferase WcaI